MIGLYCFALLLTVAVELAIVAALAPGRRRGFLLATALLLNLFTHPLACAAFWSGAAPFAVLEVLVVLVEAAGFRLVAGLAWRPAASLAVAANTVTAAMSLVF